MDRVENILHMKGKVALITGAGQGVGRQVALHIASHEGTVVVNDFFLERAEAVAEEIRSFGGTALALQADVSDFDDVGRMLSVATESLGRVDVLVNNAGNMGPVAPSAAEAMTPFYLSTPEQWQRWLGVNLYGVMNCTRHALGGMIERGSGSIISIISEASRYGDANMEAYAGAKAATAGIMRSVARGNARHGIRANCVAIAATRTPATEAAFSNPEVAKAFKLYPLRRPGEPTDVANMVLFLASNASAYVTGQVYAVNGGFLFSL